MFKIEKGVSIPNIKSSEGAGHFRVFPVSKYPIRDLEIGESFYVPFSVWGKVRHTGYFGSYFRRLKPKKFVARRNDGGIRVWRVE